MDIDHPKVNINIQIKRCGAKGDRTLDLHVANVALYQLSYRPEKKVRNISVPPACRQAFIPLNSVRPTNGS